MNNDALDRKRRHEEADRQARIRELESQKNETLKREAERQRQESANIWNKGKR